MGISAVTHQANRLAGIQILSLAVASVGLAACGSGSSMTSGPGTGNSAGSGGHAASTGGTMATGVGGSNTGASGQTGAGGSVITGAGGGGVTGAGGSGDAGTTGGGGASGTGGITSQGGAPGGNGGGGPGGNGGMPSSDWGTPVSGGPSGTGVSATVTVNTGTTVGSIGPGFVGFSYEKTHITNASLTSANSKLIALYKLLGVPTLRIGANDVDVSSWGGTGTASSTPSGQPFSHTIVSGMVDQFCGFLQATGSQSIYGVNFMSGDVAKSTAEVAYVMGKCPTSIYGIELGNEIDKYGSWANQKQKWEALGTSVIGVPGAMLIGPAAEWSAPTSFTVPFTQDESAKFGSRLRLITNHYYNGGAGTSEATAATLQNLKSNITSIADIVNSAATKAKVPGGWRYAEANTFWGKGQLGVSDTIIAALWNIDFLFLTAEHNGTGVDFHAGEPGQSGPGVYYYSSIAELGGMVTSVQPGYYGLLLFSKAGYGSILSTAVNSSNPNFSAYSVKGDGYITVVLVNRNANNGVNAAVNVGAPITSSSAIYLQGTPAGSLSAGAGSVTLAGSTVTTEGTWNRKPPYIQSTSGNTASVYVPPVTAALVRVAL